MERYNRQIMLPQFGPEGQERLRHASVLIVGLGGLGAPVAMYLAAAGVGKLGLCDADTVSLSNLQRQILYRTEDVGRPKSQMAARRIAELNPEVTAEEIPSEIDSENAPDIISRYDMVVDCTDNFATRYLIDDTCAEQGKLWVHGAIGEMAGQVAVFGPDLRYAQVYPDREYLCSLPRAAAGVIGPLPGIIGSLQAAEVIKIITGMGKSLYGHIATFNIASNQYSTIHLTPNI